MLSKLVTGTGAALLLAACSSNSDVPSGPEASDTAMASADPSSDAGSAQANAHTAHFLTDAMKGDNGEVRVGKLAAEKGSAKGVRDYGKMLAEDHGTHLTKVNALAQSMNVPATAETKAEADELYSKLQGLSGAAFDKAFIEGMIADHKKDIAAFQEEAASGDPAPVTDMARETVPTLQKHLKTAQSLQ